MSAPARQSMQVTAIGNISAELAGELAPFVEVSKSDHCDAALIAPGHELDSAALRNELAIRSSIILVRPTRSQVRALADLTGISAGDDLDAVICSRDRRGGYHTHAIPAVPSRGAEGWRTTPSLGEAITQPAATGFPSVPTPPAMFANYGSYAGLASYTWAFQDMLDAPFANNAYDDLYILNKQVIDCPCSITFFIYYVNAIDAPYYAVFVSVMGTSVCNGTTNPSTSIGWMRPMMQVTLSGPSNVSPRQSSPPSGDATNGVNVFLTDRLELLGTTSAGPNNPYPLTPAIGQTLTYPGWGITKEQSGDQSLVWTFYQSMNWNPVTNPGSEWQNWYNTNNIIFDANWNIMEMTDQSVGNLSFQVLSEWYITPPGPPGPPPPDYVMPLSLEIDLSFALFHNSSACSGSVSPTGRPANHLFWQQVTKKTPAGFGVQFAQFALIGNLTQPLGD